MRTLAGEQLDPDAMWLAENWDEVLSVAQSLCNDTTHPTAVRQAHREAQQPRASTHDFKAWVGQATNISRAQAYRYIDIAKHWDQVACLTRETPDLTIRGALEAIGKGVNKPQPKASTTPTFTEADAEYAQPLAFRSSTPWRPVARGMRPRLLSPS